MAFSIRLKEAFKTSDVETITNLLNQHTINSIQVFKYAYKKNYLNLDVIKCLIEYFLSKNINIHSDNEYIFNILCNLNDYTIIKWFVEYCNHINSRIDTNIYKNILGETYYYYTQPIAQYLFEHNESLQCDMYVIEKYCKYNFVLLKFGIEYYYKNNIRFDTYCNDLLIASYDNNNKNVLNYLIYLYKHKYNDFDLILNNELFIERDILDIFDNCFITKYINSRSQYTCLYNNNLYYYMYIPFNSHNNCLNYMIVLH